MSTVEDRVVAMKLDNKQFEPAAKTTLSTLDKLKSALSFSGSNKGLNDLQNSANRFTLSGMANGIEGVSKKFLAMSTVAIAALGTIVSKAVTSGAQLVKAFTLDPIKMGLQEYESTLNSTQTVMSGTGESVEEVTKTLAELNAYSDRTIFSFSDMTKNISAFTNAGLSSKDAAKAIIGISNVAADAGVNAEAAGRAMFGFGQAMSMGFVGLQDWNQIDSAGLGTKKFKEELIDAGLAAGTLTKANDGVIKTNKGTEVTFKNLRTTLQDQWLSSEALVKTLEKYSDTSTKVGKKAAANATQVKTFSQLLGILKESAQSGWSSTFLNLFGNLKEASALWTDVNKVVGGYISDSAKARNKMVATWKDLGGRKALLESFRNIFAVLVKVMKPIKEAFRDIFPAMTGKKLYALTKTFLEFTEGLKIGKSTIEDIKRTARGFFAILSIGVSIIKGVLGVLGNLFGFVSDGSGSFLDITGNIGDFLVKLDKTIKKGDLINKFFAKLGQVIMIPIQVLKELGGVMLGVFKGLFKGFDKGLSEGIADAFGRIGDRLAPLAGLGGKVSAVWEKLAGVFRVLAKFLAPVGAAIGTALHGIGDAIGKAFKAGDFNSVYDALNTGLLVGIVVLIKKFMDKGIKLDFGGGLLSSIKDTFGALTNTLTAMQNQVQAKTLLLIAGAVALLTVSIIALSLIDSDKLTKSLAAISVAFGQLLAAMAILTKISGSAGFLKIPTIASAMILLATAVLILTFAVKNLSDLSWEELSKGLSGVALLLAMIVGVSKGLEKSSGSMLRAGAAMIPLAIGLKILASVVKDFAEMSWGEMAKGMVGLAGALLIIAGAMQLMPKDMVVKAAGLLLVSAALKVIGSVLQDMGGMTWEQIAKGMVTLAGALAILAGGMYLMTGALPGAAALIVAAVAIAILTPALVAIGNMKWESIAKGLVLLTGALLILAGGMYLMTAGIAGAAALVVVAGALAILVPVMIALGSMSWESIAKGLAALAGVFLVLGVAGLVLTPVVPMIVALAVSLLLLGVSFALIGVGALAVATAFSIFAAAGAAGITVLIGLISLIPMFMAKFAEGIGTFIVTLAEQGTKITKAFASLLVSLLDAVILILPKVGEAFTKIITVAVDILMKNTPKLANAGMKLIIAVLRAMRDNIDKVIDVATQLIVKFLNGISRNLPKIVNAGTNLVIKFIKAIGNAQARIVEAAAKMIVAFVRSLARTIRDNTAAMRSAGLDLASAIISGMTGGLSDMAWKAAKAAASMAKNAFQAAKDALLSRSPSKKFIELGKDSALGLAIGTDRNAHLASKAAENMSTGMLDKVRLSMNAMTGIVTDNMHFNPVIKPVLDLTEINKNAPKISKLIDQKSLSADLSFNHAVGISDAQLANQESASNVVVPAGDTILKFEQVNNSPEALDPLEVYRNTRSLLHAAKEALTK